MNYKTIYAFLFFIFFLSSSNFAQITSGSIEMSVTDFNMPDMAGEDSNQDMMGGMMNSMKMTMYFKPGQQVTDMDMMGMMQTKTIYKDNMSIQYMDMMGSKIKITSALGQDMFDQYGIDQETLATMYQVKYDKSETKTILDYSCYKAIITMNMSDLIKEQDYPAELKNMEIEMYITDDIKMDSYSFQQIPGLKLDGTPLQMNMDVGPMKMTFEATQINTTVDDSHFAEPSGDYKEMTLEEFQNMAGGFGK